VVPNHNLDQALGAVIDLVVDRVTDHAASGGLDPDDANELLENRVLEMEGKTR
jgi:hypothetical protein